MNNKMRILFLISIFLILCCCSKDEDPLPAATQTGANTFGCYVDGKPWVPDGINDPFNKVMPIFGGFQPTYGNLDAVGTLYFECTRSDKSKINLNIKSCYQIGRYRLDQNTGYRYTSTWPLSYGYYYDGSSFSGGTNSMDTGFVDVTVIDTARKLVSGVFEFQIYDRSRRKTISIKGGRFDLNFKKLNP